MKRGLIVLLMLISIVSASLKGAGGFQLTDKWDHGNKEALSTLVFGTIDKDGHVAASFGRSGFRLITPGIVVSFAPEGQGPDEIDACVGMCSYYDDIAFMEMDQKVKVFTKRDNTYKWKETKWLKRSFFPHIVSQFLFFKEKWFVSGIKALETDKEAMKNYKYKEYALIKIHDNKGLPLTTLVHKPFTGMNRYEQMDHHLFTYKSSVFLVVENELKLYEISTDKLAVIRDINLEVPAGYKKMPRDFYNYKGYNDPSKELRRDIEYWKTSYSLVTKAVAEDGYFVLQIRIFDDKNNKFALLFYNADTLKLEKKVPIDDYFIGSRNGKYYFYANGNPGWDEDTENIVINIYSIKGKL